jgi:diguanylate cyclase (GGDEF)-like protein/PAS domain S-box-containing protein
VVTEETEPPSRSEGLPPGGDDAGPTSPPSGFIDRLRETDLFEGMVTSTPSALYVVDGDGIVHMWNPAAERLFGWSADEVLGRRLPIVDRANDAEFDALRASVMAGDGFVNVEATRRRKDGTAIELSLSTVPLRDRQGEIVAVFGVSQDMTRTRKAEAALLHQATHDPLTDLLNRRAFLELVQDEVDASRRQTALVFLDLDDFKDVNDTQGHHIGDALLREFAKRLRGSLRRDSVVGRLGGDEFGVLLVDVSERHVPEVVARLLEHSCGPFVVAGCRLVIHASAGIALCAHVSDAEEALRHADMAMYEAKRTARNSFRMFDANIQRAVVARVELAAALDRALDDDELDTYYQPVVSVGSGRVVGMEALVRWHRGENGVDPEHFIPLAEQTGTIGRLGRWVLDRACSQISRWSGEDRDYASLVMSVNLSPRQLHEPGLVDHVREILLHHGLEPGQLQLEVTETALTPDVPAAAAVLGRLRRLGVLLAIDDFGTGNSSLTLLRQMPFSILKIDRSFVAGIGTSPEDTAIVAATLGLAQSLGLVTTAEGVETDEQLAFLRHHGCDQAQGYLLGRPVTAAQFKTAAGSAASADEAIGR